MKRAILIVGLAFALVFTGGLDRAFAGGEIVVAAAPQKESPSGEQGDAEKKLSPEQTMARRFPQSVRVGDLVGLPVLDDDDSTIGFIKDVVRDRTGKIQLIVPYAKRFGWIGNGGFFERWRRPVAVPIEVVAILGRQVAALEMPREDFEKASDFVASQATPIGREETILIAITRR